MDLKQLEYFRHVAELGSFTRAAAFLSVVQPSLSRYVRQLEVELGHNLFERNGRGVVLTAAGSRLLEHSRGILAQVGRIRADLEDQRLGDCGSVALGLPPSLGSTITVPLVKACGEILPNARLGTVEGLSAYILEWLHMGRVDFGLVYNASPSANVDVLPLLNEPLYLIAPLPGRPAAGGRSGSDGARKTRRVALPSAITLAKLAELPLIIPSRPHAMRMVVEGAVASVGRQIRVAHEIESIPAVVDLVRQGYGHAVLPASAVRSSAFGDQVVAIQIGAQGLSIPLCIATSTQRPTTALMRKAIQVIRSIVRQEILPDGHAGIRATG
jgi:LysR family nitrogen assimilation transcriptional regulator